MQVIADPQGHDANTRQYLLEHDPLDLWNGDTDASSHLVIAYAQLVETGLRH